MMDVFERYFHYEAVCICGIPKVTLEGTTADWERITEKVAGLSVFELDWWLPHLVPICEQFVRASRGKPDVRHWQRICKLSEAYGGDIINGWIAKLFPYIRSFVNGPCNERNPIFETGEGFSTLYAPSGLSRVPFTWRNSMTGRVRAMEAIGGLVGVTQEAETLALRPMVGWAVREAEKLDTLLARLVSEHTTFAGANMERKDSREWQPEPVCRRTCRASTTARMGPSCLARASERLSESRLKTHLNRSTGANSQRRTGTAAGRVDASGIASRGLQTAVGWPSIWTPTGETLAPRSPATGDTTDCSTLSATVAQTRWGSRDITPSWRCHLRRSWSVCSTVGESRSGSHRVF